MATKRKRKFTMVLEEDLMQRARRVSKRGITPTVRESLKLYAAQEVYSRLLEMKGKGGFTMTWQELRGDE
jgi:hypothetical protein